MRWEVRQGDALERLQAMPSESVQCVITSPPYYGLRDYSVPGQLGLEATPDEYVARMVEVFREVRRVLRGDGTVWLNIGDSYNADARKGRAHMGIGKNNGFSAWVNRTAEGTKPKDLLGIPWLLAFALRADGWYLRSDIIWSKPNPMPESVTDRPTSAHEHLFLLSRSPRYFYDADAIREEHTYVADERELPRDFIQRGDDARGRKARMGLNGSGRNKRNVWEIATQPYPEAHFATFPCKLVEPCVLAGSSPKCCGVCGAPWVRVVEDDSVQRRESWRGSDRGNGYAGVTGGHFGRTGGWYPHRRATGWRSSCDHDDDTGRCVILDPFAGSGTVGVVALRHDRSFIGIELSPAYVEMARRRIVDDAPLLNAPAEMAS